MPQALAAICMGERRAVLTYSSAPDYAESGIYMSAVDPGWIFHQALNMTLEIEEAYVSRSLNMVDAAARVCDPVFAGIRFGEYKYGKFFKDYDESWAHFIESGNGC